MNELFQDPVVAEIHAVRAAMLAKAGGDAAALMQQVAERQRNSEHHIITQPFRTLPAQNLDPEHVCQ